MLKSYKLEVILMAIVIAVIALVINATKVHEEEQEQLKAQEAIETSQGYYDSFEFGEIFKHMLNKHGEGHVFEWRDKQYTVVLKEAENGK